MASSNLLDRLLDDVVYEDFPGLSTLKLRLGIMLAAGDTGTEREIEVRKELASLLARAYEMDGRRNPRYLQDAIENYETIVDRLPQNSHDRAIYLGEMSYAYMSLYMASESQHALDEAVRCGRLAKRKAAATGLNVRDAKAYRKILSDAGIALSHSAQRLMKGGTADKNTVLVQLNEAIECEQEIRANVPRGSQEYLKSLVNLASRLQARVRAANKVADREEAVKILREVQSTSSPASQIHGIATMELGQMAMLKYDESGDLQDLDAAIAQIQVGLATMSAGVGPASEHKPSALNQLAFLYRGRYERSKDRADLTHALRFSNENLRSFPAVNTHQIRGKYLLQHLRIARDFAYAATSADEIWTVLRDAEGHLNSMAPEYAQQPLTDSSLRNMFANRNPQYPQRQDCNRFLCDIYGHRYIRSRKLEHLTQALTRINKFGFDYGEQALRSGAKPKLDSPLVYSLSIRVQELSKTPAGPARDAGERVLYEEIAAICNAPDFMLAVFLKVTEEFNSLLKIYVEAATQGMVITDQEAQRKAQELVLQTQVEDKKRLARGRYKPQPYTTELGLRSLAIDPINRKIVMDLSGFLGDVLFPGIDPAQGMAPSEFARYHEKLEMESVEKAKAEGKHPNPHLCRMCRHIKVLEPAVDSTAGKDTFRWNSGPWIWPFGNWSQLRLRQHCVMCRLVFSLIITDPVTQTLHPRLGAIDREVQGISMYLSEIKGGSRETFLTVEYGMQHVGELRIVTENNEGVALRQGWQLPNLAASAETIDYRAMQNWLLECILYHGRGCNRVDPYRTSGSEDEGEDIPLLLIDVNHHCLVRSTSASVYLALSYVWGNVDMSKTLLSNVEARCEKQALPPLEKLPKTIADAMEVTRRLRQAYLWVDALCIIQDDTANKMRDIERMDIIYRKSHATLLALDVANADAGLPGVRPFSRSPQQVETLELDAGNEDLDCSPHGGDGASQKVSIRLAAAPPALHLNLASSKWNTRGWTFQERLLSRRCFFFTNHCVYFHCHYRNDGPPHHRHHICCEGGINAPLVAKDPRWGDDGTADDGGEHEHRPLAPTRTALDNPLSALLRSTYSAPPTRLIPTQCLSAYAGVVAMYTTRQFTYPGDIINAFRGILSVLNPFVQGQGQSHPILCGLPASFLDLALLWAPVGRISRRALPRKEEPGVGGVPGPGSKAVRRPVLPWALQTNRGTELVVCGPVEGPQQLDETVDRAFPSWSWAGWEGSVEYRFLADMLPEEPLPKALVSEWVVNAEGRCKAVRVSGRGAATSAAAPSSKGLSEAMGGGALEGTCVDFCSTNLKLPNVLQFHAATVPLTAFRVSDAYEYISSKDSVHAHSNQSVRPILDSGGKRCGLWWEQAGYHYVGRGVSPAAEEKMLFVAVSRHEDTCEPRKGPSRAEGEISLFDDDVYPAVGKGSALINVLAVDLNMGHEYGERITVARIHSRAWEDAGPVTKLVRLV